MITRKMLFIGALFTILVNVNTLGAWASPSAAKAASAHTNYRWARHRAQKASDSGCPTMNPDGDAQRDGDLEQVVTPAKSPCETAKEQLATAKTILTSLIGQHTIAAERSRVARSDLGDLLGKTMGSPTLTPTQQAQLGAAYARMNETAKREEEAQTAVDNQRQFVSDAELAVKRDCGTIIEIAFPEQPVEGNGEVMAASSAPEG